MAKSRPSRRNRISPERLAAILRERTATYLPGTRLPTRSELSDFYNVGEHIVRQAIAMLADEGVVEVRPKAGVFVRQAPIGRGGVRRVIALVQTWETAPQRLFEQLVLLGADRRCRHYQLEFDTIADPAGLDHAEVLLELADGDPTRVGWMFVDLVPPEHLLMAWSIQGVPTVLVDRYAPAATASTVSLDFQRATYQATDKLILLGHRRIAFVGPLIGGPIISSRVEGFRMAMDRHGVPVADDLMWDDAVGKPGHTRPMVCERLGSADPRPTAVVAANQRIGAETLAACDDLELSLPGQLSLIAAGAKMPDTPSGVLSRLSRYEEGSPEQLGETAVDVLSESHRNPAAVQVLLGSEWIDAGSAGPVPETGS